MSMLLLPPLISTFCGALAFVSKRKHLLNALLSLEFTMLSVFWVLITSLSSHSKENISFMLYFLAIAACEGALGLTILILITRSHGNDNFSTFNILQC